MSPKSTNSGIRKLSNGDAVIPSSVRADGTVRKEIRVKPGYKPPEDVEVYKNRTAEAWKNRGKGGVPGVQGLEKDTSSSGAANKNAKRREARKRAAAAGADDGGEGEGKVEEKADGVAAGDEKADLDPEAERAKEARKLAKKLRQAKDLQDKKARGDELLPEQLAKVIKMKELIRQLDGLGFDAEGEKKAQSGGQTGD